MQLAGMRTRLGGSFGKGAFREFGGYFGNSRRAWAAAGQPVHSQMKRKALTKQSCWNERLKGGLFVCLLAVPSGYYHLYSKKGEKRKRSNEIWGQAMTQCSFSLERLQPCPSTTHHRGSSPTPHGLRALSRQN